jgi:biofilm PGA synthesis protein PgaD
VARPLIIERPERQSSRQRWLYGVMTLGFWLIYIYLWLPLITLAGWTFGVWRGYDILVLAEGFRAFRTLLVWYGLGIGVFTGSLVLWAGYNIVRFRGVDRRQPALPLELGEQAAYYGVPAGALAAWRQERILVVCHVGHGRLSVVTPQPAPDAVAASRVNLQPLADTRVSRLSASSSTKPACHRGGGTGRSSLRRSACRRAGRAGAT